MGALSVRRALPRRRRRTVGAWCFADHMGPGSVSAGRGVDIGPHPHIGLQTVTWLLRGELVHRDSLGSEQLIRPGQLNLMTAGQGVAHAEETTGYRGPLEGVQLWVAQPDATRSGAPAFEHHPSVPEIELASCDCTLLVGSFAGSESLARRDTEHVGVDVRLRPGATLLPLRAAFEHALVVLAGILDVDGRSVNAGHLVYLGTGRDELPLRVSEPARALLLGGEPFEEPVLMWWNYVARDRVEIAEAHRAWLEEAPRFGAVDSTLPRVIVGPPPWSASPKP